MQRIMTLAALALVSSGCAHGGLMPTEDHRTFAADAFEYAVLAQNAYARPHQWLALPDDVSLIAECPNDEIGLAYSIFVRQEPGKKEYVFAFRGTEDRLDWAHGNFRFDQQERAEPIVRRFVEAHPADDIVFVGHSLGGALAIHGSLRNQGRRVYVFNSSPRFYVPAGYDSKADASDRLSIVEKGEVLKAVRIPFKEAWQTYMPYNCFGKGDAIEQHSMLKLAMCLTRIAASEPASEASHRARLLIDRNPWAIKETTHPLRPVKPLAGCWKG